MAKDFLDKLFPNVEKGGFWKTDLGKKWTPGINKMLDNLDEGVGHFQDMTDWGKNAIEDWWHGGDKGAIESFERTMRLIEREQIYGGGISYNISEEKYNELLGKGWTEDELNYEIEQDRRYNELQREAFKFIWESYGSPFIDIRDTETRETKPKGYLNRARYRTAEDDTDYWGFQPDTMSVYRGKLFHHMIAELAHAPQFGNLDHEEMKLYDKLTKYDFMTFPESEYGMLKYDVPGSFEEEAHERIEPIIREFMLTHPAMTEEDANYKLSDEDKAAFLKKIDEVLFTVRRSQVSPHHTEYQEYPDEMFRKWQEGEHIEGTLFWPMTPDYYLNNEE